MSLKENYIKEIRRELGFWPTWVPGSPINIGTVGLIKDLEINQVSTLDKKQLEYDLIKDKPIDLNYKSYGGVEIINKLSGRATIEGSGLAEADAGILINFGKKAAIVLKTKELHVEVIEDIDGMGELIVDRFKRGNWQDDWVVVTEVLRAKSATILISETKNSKLELKANIRTGQVLDIADAGIEFQTLKTSGLATEIIAKKGITIGYKMWGIKKHFLSGTKFEPKGENYSPDLIEKEGFEPIFEEI